MPAVIANPNIEGRSVVEFELRLPNKKIVPFNSVEVTHISSTITESIKRATRHELVIRTPSTSYVDNIIRYAQSEGTPQLRYRVGVGISGRMVYLPWQESLILDFGAALEGLGGTAGHVARISLGDPLFALARNTKVVVRKGKISDIVKQIATESGIISAVIEPTKGDGLWIQSFVDDVDFIRKRMIPRAINDKGRGAYNFYIQDNVLHFHSPDYQAYLKELVYYEPTSLALTQLDESQNYLETGASGVRLVSYDPYTAQIKEVVSDPSKALRLGNSMHQLSKIKGAELNYWFHLGTNSPQEAENLAQAIYENARMQTLGIELKIAKTISLRVGDLLRIIISPSASKSSVWSGVYVVTDAVYKIVDGALVNSFVIRRGEFETNSLSPTTVNILGSNLVISGQEAPGQPLNLKSVASSPLTHGAGREGFTSVFIDTQDRNKPAN